MEEVMCYIPENLEEALAIIDERDAMVLAGGSDLMVSGANGTGVNPSSESIVFPSCSHYFKSS